jgi:hypothetical protein
MAFPYFSQAPISILVRMSLTSVNTRSEEHVVALLQDLWPLLPLLRVEVGSNAFGAFVRT